MLRLTDLTVRFRRSIVHRESLAPSIFSFLGRSSTSKAMPNFLFKDFISQVRATPIGGVRPLWRGNGMNVLTGAPETPFKFTIYEKYKMMLTVCDENTQERFKAGAMAGATAQTAIYPLETLKTLKLYKDPGVLVSRGCGAVSATSGQMVTYPLAGAYLQMQAQASRKETDPTSTIRVMKNIGEAEFYRGTLPRLMKALPAVGIAYVIYDQVLKTRLTLSKTNQYKGIRDCAKQMLMKEGVRAFSRGYIPNILGITMYTGIDLAVYETLKTAWLSRHNKDSNPNANPGVLVTLGCGAVSATSGQMVSYPLALVRTQMQAQASRKETDPTSTIRVMKNIGEAEFYRGTLPRLMKALPAVGIAYVIYDQVKKFWSISK